MIKHPDLRAQLLAAFEWRGDRGSDGCYADVTGWWRDPTLLGQLGPALAALYADDPPTLILGLESRGSLLGPLVAQAIGVGFVEVRKDPEPAADSDAWVKATTPPDYRDRHLVVGFPRRLVGPTDRLLLVDEWVDTGGQGLGVHALVAKTRARWLGMAVIVDALTSHETRRQLAVRSLLSLRDL